jgi:glycosyltransferase involved in cell wall biosynthesis
MLAFDIFVLPSVKEGFPWALIEAMAAKLPVVATSVGAVPEIIEDGKNGILVGPAKPEQLAGKINDLLNDERLQQELGIQAHQAVLFKFSLEKMVREVEAILDNHK